MADHNNIPGANHLNIDAASTLPLCSKPPTEIMIDGLHIVLTGNFRFGNHEEVSELITSNGGFIGNDIDQRCHFLVIGNIGNDSWLQSSSAPIIEQAVTLRDQGHSIAIITEAYFFEHLRPGKSTLQKFAPIQNVNTQQDPLQKLKQLGELRDAGVVTEQEFLTKKTELLKQI